MQLKLIIRVSKPITIKVWILANSEVLILLNVPLVQNLYCYESEGGFEKYMLLKERIIFQNSISERKGLLL